MTDVLMHNNPLINNENSFDEELNDDFMNEDINEHNRRRNRMGESNNMMQSSNQIFDNDFNTN